MGPLATETSVRSFLRHFANALKASGYQKAKKAAAR